MDVARAATVGAPEASRSLSVTLSLCLGASQATLLVVTPVLASVAVALDVSTATAGQLRMVSGGAAGITACLAGLAAARVGLRELLASGLVLLAAGSVLSAAAPTFEVLIGAQLVVGMGVGVTYSAAVAAAAEWSGSEHHARLLAIALLGPPAAWVVGMPLAGLLGGLSWRLVWIGVPLAPTLAALVLVVQRPRTPPAGLRADPRSVLSAPGVVSWSAGELLAYSAWAGTLVYTGALFVESYRVSVEKTGLILGAGALAYVPGNLLARRWIATHRRTLLVGLGLAAATTVAALGTVRPAAWASLLLFALLSFIAGGRTLAGSASALDLAPELRLGVTGLRTAALQFGYFVGAAVGGAALAAGGYPAVGLGFAALFAAATVPHLPRRIPADRSA